MFYNHIQISKINDFLFCPRSLYFHSVYEDFESSFYKSVPQIAGKIIHKNIDNTKFSSKKRYLSATNIFSDKYGLIGKIDIYDSTNKTLIERKKKIKKIYLGHKYQLYAQRLCMLEMGYLVKNMKIYSYDDNKNYKITLTEEEEDGFFKLLDELRKYQISKKDIQISTKCNNCIYRELCKK